MRHLTRCVMPTAVRDQDIPIRLYANLDVGKTQEYLLLPLAPETPAGLAHFRWDAGGVRGSGLSPGDTGFLVPVCRSWATFSLSTRLFLRVWAQTQAKRGASSV